MKVAMMISLMMMMLMIKMMGAKILMEDDE